MLPDVVPQTLPLSLACPESMPREAGPAPLRPDSRGYPFDGLKQAAHSPLARVVAPLPLSAFGVT